MSYLGEGIARSVGSAILVLAAVCFGAGAILVWGAPKLWAWVKPFIHLLTA